MRKSRIVEQEHRARKQGDHCTVFWTGKTGATGVTYRGEWLEDEKHGYGVQTYRNGTPMLPSRGGASSACSHGRFVALP